jgi:VIT1/CCC1 family predicted Fe2+/Mn2+ transporter
MKEGRLVAPTAASSSRVLRLVAGALSMATGEYVSVHSQADTELVDLDRERKELARSGPEEHRELAAIYVARSLDPALAMQVAEQLMTHDALGAHARDELGISTTLAERPAQSALASAASFAVGAALPMLVAALALATLVIGFVCASSLAFLALLGAIAARGITAGVGTLFGAIA